MSRVSWPIPIITIFMAVLIVLVLLVATIGAVSISVLDIITLSLSSQESAILYSIRLPRIVLGALVGAALAVAGAAMQGIFRNPLADPGLIGISSGAALSVGVVIVFADSISGVVGLYGISFAAFLGGIVTCYIILQFAKIGGEFSVIYMLLAGIAINALAGAGTGILTYLSDDQQLRALTFWTMGSLGGALWPSVIVASTIIIPSAMVIMRCANDLNILLLGDDEAQYLGLEAEKIKKKIIICAAFAIGAAVSVSGIIGFVGLVVPHLIRISIGSNNQLVMPLSALLGAILLVLSDTLARTLVSPSELPVGTLTSLIGGPFFLWLLMRQYSGRFGL